VRVRLWWLGMTCLLLLFGATWLYRYDQSGVVAILDKVDGTVEHERSGAPGRFERAAPGNRFRVGDAVKTGRGATAVLALDDGSRLALEQDTLLRFLAAPPDTPGRGLGVETGSARLETGGDPLDLYTSVGLAHIEPGTKVVLGPRASGLRFSLEVGLARFETKQGTVTLAPGDELAIDIGGAVIESRKSGEPVLERAASREPPEAETIAARVEGKGTRAKGPEESAWRGLAPGTVELAPGSSLEVPSGSRVVLTSDGGSVSLQGKGQFIVGARDAPFVQTVAGRLFVDRGRTPLELAVPGGSITMRPWSKAEAAVDSSRTTLRVGAGSLEVLGAFGRDDLHAGESATLSRGGRLEVSGRGPAYADMVVSAGSSFVVHDPSPPTSVGFLLQDVCPKGGVVEQLGPSGSRPLASARGAEAANLLLARGTHRYQVRCVDARGLAAKSSASGVVTILRDSGTGTLSRVPPLTRIDVDGRSYTVMYQNLLPQIIVRWPKAPAASSYTLTLDGRGAGATRQMSQPTLTLEAGQLKEGTYTLTFAADGKKSLPTRVAIVFDNASPTARIQSPEDRSFRPGSSVNVAGVAVPGWGISVGGRELVLDAQARFSEQVTASSAQQALQLRFTHPRRGVHYYLRHAAGAAL
jgi:hypothetical protein